MKVDELLKHLENIKTDEDEKCKIAESIARKSSVDDLTYMFKHRIMTKDRTIYYLDSYGELFGSIKISPGDVYVFIENNYLTGYDLTSYLYPFLVDRHLLPYAYLAKLGLETDFCRIVPATGLRYVAVVYHLSRGERRIVAEVVNIDTAVINTNLLTLIRRSAKNIGHDELEEIMSQLDSQKLFAGYDFNEARRILNRYYENNDTSLAKEVEAIRDDYNYIFKPCRVIYDLETKQFVVGDNNES
jgi:hypothetical protein